MCGITALLGVECVELLLNSLKELQNRGYDSAGISTIKNNTFYVNKFASTTNNTALKLLEDNIETNRDSINGIAHTRWATHGEKNDMNSHPHVSMCGKFSLVHNGIIENYESLKNMLLGEGYTFQSKTDTEIIVNLLSYIYKQKEMTIHETIQLTVEQLEGTWGLVIQYIEEPLKLYCTRNGSPLLVGHNKQFAMVVSEQSGFYNQFDEYIVLDNNDICEMELMDSCIHISTKQIYKHQKTLYLNQQTTPAPYPHWTLKEIYEQVDSSLRSISLGGRLLSHHKVKLGGLDSKINILSKIKNIYLLGCGTSLFAAKIAVYYFKDLCDFYNVQAFDGAEFTEQDISSHGESAFILISQSGETKDLHRCIDIAKSNHIFLIGVVNVPDSMIAREVHCGCYLNAGREVAVASTKSFTSQVIILSMIAIWFSQTRNIHTQKREQYITDLKRLYMDIETTIKITDKNIDTYLDLFTDKSSCFILGKSKGEYVAKEGALKIKEISYIHAEGYSSSSLKHGPFALLGKGFPVVLLGPKNEYYYKSLNVYEEIASRNANILFITNDKECSKPNTLFIPTNDTYIDLLCAIPLQLLAYKLSIRKGLNPDMPRNLAKVVTVE